MLQRVWMQLEYHLDILRATRGGNGVKANKTLRDVEHDEKTACLFHIWFTRYVSL